MRKKLTKGYVYVLKTPVRGNVFYVGCSLNPQYRLWEHILTARNDTSPLYNYIRRLKSIPVIEIIDELMFIDKITLLNRELYWIEQFHKMGYRLFNRSHVSKRMCMVRE